MLQSHSRHDGEYGSANFRESRFKIQDLRFRKLYDPFSILNLPTLNFELFLEWRQYPILRIHFSFIDVAELSFEHPLLYWIEVIDKKFSFYVVVFGLND